LSITGRIIAVEAGSKGRNIVSIKDRIFIISVTRNIVFGRP